MKKYTHYFVFLILNLLIAVSVFGIYFLYQKIENALNTQERIKLEQEIQAQQIKNLPQLSARYQKILDSEQYFTLLYPEEKVVDIIKDIERLAKEQAVTLTITQKEVPEQQAPKAETKTDASQAAQEPATPKELADTLPYEKNIRLELSAKGKYVAIRNFLHKIETAPYALDVLSIQGGIAPKEDDVAAAPSPQVSNPFLLSGAQSGPTEPVVSLPTDAAFLIEVALYIQ
jgi:hypothetical protein